MKRIVVTGGSGKAGHATIKELLARGYEVENVDLVPPRERLCHHLKTDLCDLGQVFEVLLGADAVIHLGAIPAPDLQPSESIFRHNTMSTYNVFTAAVSLGLKRVVWASSETILGVPLDNVQPDYVPMDEEHPPIPETGYALSKTVSEEMARQFNRWSGIPFVGLRFSNIMLPEDYERFPSFSKDPMLRKWNLWSYVDARDVGKSCLLALETDIKGAEAFIIAAEDTVMMRTSRELMAEVFPGVPFRREIGEFESLLSSEKARKVLGFRPLYSWRNR